MVCVFGAPGLWFLLPLALQDSTGLTVLELSALAHQRFRGTGGARLEIVHFRFIRPQLTTCQLDALRKGLEHLELTSTFQ